MVLDAEGAAPASDPGVRSAFNQQQGDSRGGGKHACHGIRERKFRRTPRPSRVQRCMGLPQWQRAGWSRGAAGTRELQRGSTGRGGRWRC
jgi:hypothetical protein